MFVKTKRGYYVFERFAEIEGLIHGFSTQSFGSMKGIRKKVPDILPFAKALGIDIKDIVGMDQVHGNKVVLAKESLRGKLSDNTDGLVTHHKKIFLYGCFADCVPILFYDGVRKFFAIAHAGWRGTLSEIVKVLVLEMIRKGSVVSNIMVGIGPSIRVCCYDIAKDRAQLIADAFPKWQELVLTRKNGKIFFDMQKLLTLQLTSLGIPNDNIEDCGICTSDNTHEFFSFRKSMQKETYPVFAGIIGRV